MNAGINHQQRQEIAQGLASLLANTYLLQLKTQNFHWNVTGPMFTTLHTLFETHYSEMAMAVDEIAERIRALGEFAPGSYQQFAKLAQIKEETQAISANNMVRQLLEGHETISRIARDITELTAAAHDEVSTDLLISRMQVHEKTAWMLRSLLDEK